MLGRLGNNNKETIRECWLNNKSVHAEGKVFAKILSTSIPVISQQKQTSFIAVVCYNRCVCVLENNIQPQTQVLLREKITYGVQYAR